MKQFRTLLFAVVALTATASLFAETFTVDKAHSEASFQIRHLVSKVRGKFDDFAGVIELDPANLANSNVEFTMKTASIDTNNPDRDKHLRSADFFDAEKNSEITFKSRKVAATSTKDVYAVTGILTMRGVSRTITLPVTFLGFAKDPWGSRRAGFETHITLNRKDYGINWNKALDNGGTLLSDDVDINISIEAAAAAKK